MDRLRAIGDRALQRLEEKNAARDRALQTSRTLIRHCAHAIRAAHRGEAEAARAELDQARGLAESLRRELQPHPDLYHSGYAQDALKEYSEASLVLALVAGAEIPDPDSLGVEVAAYLGGLGETVGELRRRCLDLLRADRIEEAEQTLAAMDDIYDLLVTVDYPDAITGGLRRITDVARSLVERTRGDLTVSHQQRSLRRALAEARGRLDPS